MTYKSSGCEQCGADVDESWHRLCHDCYIDEQSQQDGRAQATLMWLLDRVAKLEAKVERIERALDRDAVSR